MTEEPLHLPPKPTVGDRSIGVALAALSEIPGGGTVIALLDAVFGLPYARRQDAWQRKLYEMLMDLQARDIDLDGLSDRPDFVTAVHDATRIAMGEHVEEKLDQLKAVLFNAAVQPSDVVADMWTLRYLRWIDELEPAHIEILAFGIDPRGWLQARGKPTADFYSAGRRAAFDQADWPYPADLIELILEDLARLQLGGPGTGMVSGRSVYDPWISSRGRRFLDWLTIV